MGVGVRSTGWSRGRGLPGGCATSPETPSRSAPRLRTCRPGHLAAVEAMAEVGIDLPDQPPKVITTGAVEASDVVITMGCGDACSILPGKRWRGWAMDHVAHAGSRLRSRSGGSCGRWRAAEPPGIRG